MRIWIIILLSVFGVFTAPTLPAQDNSPADFRAPFLAGAFDKVIADNESAETAEELSLAAESISAKILLGHYEKPRKKAKRARKLAAKALKLDPDSHEAHVQFALAYGFETQSSSPFRVWSKGLIPKTKRAIEKVRTRFPEDVRGDALLGAWNLGIVRKAGDKRAKNMFDATEADGIKYYEAALKRAPDDIIILSNYTAVLLAIDAERHEDRTMALLKRVMKAPKPDAVTKGVYARMLPMMDHMGDPKGLADIANALLGDGDEEDEKNDPDEDDE